MVVPWRLAADPAVLQGGLHDGACIELADGLAIDLLPHGHRLRGRRYPFLFPPRDFVVGHLRIAASGIHVDPDDVAGPQPGKPAAYRTFRRRIENGRTVRSARLPPIADGR